MERYHELSNMMVMTTTDIPMEDLNTIIRHQGHINIIINIAIAMRLINDKTIIPIIHIKWHRIQSVLRIWLFLWFPCLSITEMKTLSHSDRRWHCKGLGGRGGSLVGCCCCRMGHLHSPVCLQQRRRGRGIIPVVGNDGGEGDSSSSLMDEVPFLDEIVKVASSSSSKSLKIIWNSAVIFIPDIWTKSSNRSSQNTSFHFRVLNSTPKFWTKSEILK